MSTGALPKRFDAAKAEAASVEGAPSRQDSVQQRADLLAQRTAAMLRMMELGMPLHEIEQQLDWLDAQARLKPTR